MVWLRRIPPKTARNNGDEVGLTSVLPDLSLGIQLNLNQTEQSRINTFVKMDPSIAKKTQETLGKVIKKPPLTEKLLSKPPFRFLHDIITEVIKNTGVLKGLYSADEMNSANVKEKEAKIAFLQKVIDVVVIVSGVSLSVRPSKIVAGHEPEKTNELLQELAKIVLSKKSTSEAVKTVLSGGKPSKGSADGKRKESRSTSKDREISKEKEREKSAESGSTKKERGKKESTHGNGEEKKQRESSGAREDSAKREKKDRERKEKRDKSQEREKEKEMEKPLRTDEETPDAIDTGLIDGNIEESESQQNRIPRPSSAKGQRRRHAEGDVEESQGGENEGITGTDSVPPSTEQMNGVLHEDELPQQVVQSRRMARPSSARPAPPKIKKQQEEIEDQITRIGSGKQNTNVIVDDGKDDDDDETFVVEDNHSITNDVDTVPSNESIEDDSGHGGLVRKILETKKELEGSKEQPVKSVKEKSIISDAARKKERELAQKEIEKLRSSIQTLTRSANPLGKIMDYIQEDVDSMNKELEMWRTENKEHTIALKREQSITDSEIKPLTAQLEELESEITEMVDRISTVKCNILKNEEKIQKMLSSISFNSR